MSAPNALPVTTLPIEEMRQHACEVAAFLKTLANEQRLLVLCALLEGEQSVGQLNERVELSASALSQHLAWLREAGMVSTRRQAQTIFYTLADARVIEILSLLKQQFCS
jgi:DNA-binding transcriptional ArsR family regulator